MEAGPPPLVERLVARLLPPGCREPVLGDLYERYRSLGQYCTEAARTVPCAIWVQVRRTTTPALAASQIAAVYAGFATAVAWSGAPSWMPGATAALVALAIAALRDAWAANGRDVRRGILDSLLIAGAASAVALLVLAITNQPIEPRTQALAAVLCAGLLSLARSAPRRPHAALSTPTGAPAMTTPRPVSVSRHGPRRGWPVALVGLGALVGFGVSYTEAPVYQSSTTILVMPARFPRSVVPTVPTPDLSSRLNYMSQMTLSRTRLERLIQEFDLYRRERSEWPMEEVVREFRRSVSLNVNPNPDGGRQAVSFVVSYRSTDPRTAMRVTERFASLMVQTHVEEREQDAATATAFLESQQTRARERLSAAAAALVQARAAGTGTSGMAIVEVDYEVARDAYRRLLETQQAADAEKYLERRQIGEQFRVVDGARLPERPVPITRWPWTLGGALAGLAVAVVAWAISRWLGPSEPRPEPSAQPA